MTIYTALLLAAGLAADAFTVALAKGSSAKYIDIRDALKLALLFGLFQGLMPVIGWFLGLGFKDFVSAYDHWAAFALLGIIGCKMIYDDLKGNAEIEENSDESKTGFPGLGALLILALATSIDALAVGFSLLFLDSIFFPVIIIGVVTFIFSLIGVYLGHRYKQFGQNRVRIIGGLILIAIGSKILYEHLSEI